jgi:cytochrome c-type protein NapB
VHGLSLEGSRRGNRATKVAKSHYLDREDKKLKNISPRRYFCMQCHVPQFDAKPLVANTYKPAAKKGE